MPPRKGKGKLPAPAPAPSGPKLVKYLVPTDPAFCYVTPDLSDSIADWHFACGCPRCRPQLYCRLCLLESPPRYSFPYNDKQGNTDGKCRQHTEVSARTGRVLGFPPAPPAPPTAPTRGAV